MGAFNEENENLFQSELRRLVEKRNAGEGLELFEWMRTTQPRIKHYMLLLEVIRYFTPFQHRQLNLFGKGNNNQFENLLVYDILQLLRFEAGELDEEPTELSFEFCHPANETDEDQLIDFFMIQFSFGRDEGYLTEKVFAKRHSEHLLMGFKGAEYEHTPYRATCSRLPVALQWLDFLEQIANGRSLYSRSMVMPDISAETQYLTYSQAALFLSYSKQHLRDPRSDETQEAKALAKTICGRAAQTSGTQLYNEFYKYRNNSQRNIAFNDVFSKFEENRNTRSVNQLLRDVELVIERLSGEALSTAKTELEELRNKYKSMK